MIKLFLRVPVLLLLAWVQGALAAPHVLSDVFEDGDGIVQNLFSGGNQALRYRLYGPFTVDSSGEYKFWDAREGYSYFELLEGVFLNNDITITIHDEPWDINDPLGALVDEADDVGSFELVSGTEYYVVVQPFDRASGQREFAFVMDGPGDFSGGGFMRLPNFYSGRFDEDDPLTNIIPEFVGCSDSYYEVSGPHRVGQTGNYYGRNYTTFEENHMPIAFGVYEGSFDPDNPYDNQIAVGPNGTQFFMEKGKNYYFVVQPDCDIRTGRYQFIVAPPADTFLWSPFAGGSYADGAVPAQGALFDVFPDVGAVFLAWFTFANTPPDAGAEDSDIGSAEQRWMVGFGAWDEPTDTVVNVDLFKTEGGMFNMPDDPANVPQTKVGTMQLDMTERCEGGEGHYELDNGVSGTVIFRRIANDNVRPCIDQNPRPAPWFDWKVN